MLESLSIGKITHILADLTMKFPIGKLPYYPRLETVPPRSREGGS